MHYSTILALAVSASLSTMTTALPAKATSASKTPFSIYFDDAVSVTADQVLAHLDLNGLLTWHSVGGGNLTQIPEDTWSKGIKGAMKAMGNSSSLATRDLRDRNYNQDIDDVDGFSAKASCYGRDTLFVDGNIDESIGTACDALVGSSAAPLVLNQLAVWQSPTDADTTGNAGYVRYSAKLIAEGFSADTTLCQDTLQQFDNYCQDKTGATNGGEITVGDAVMFNADPTSYKYND